MTDEMIALGRRAVACKGWRWMPGMQTDSKFSRVVAVDSETGVPCAAEQGATNDDCHAVWLDDVPVLPDLTDPATLGCLLALVREAWGCAVITSPDYDYDDDEARQGPNVVGWRAVETVRWMPVGEGKTEAEALVAALELAP